ncbi:hypothetical protein IV203_015843 [Nitzschia inconspicua]|uniref:Uncharacterized protein n=1 Tax=Nitzschia inconspicua TaxID=303405 RepID=A0A9K3LBI5_9STRA|nr:hypothetical protein IV203_015843 [Nitzschia inconspicua]
MGRETTKTKGKPPEEHVPTSERSISHKSKGESTFPALSSFDGDDHHFRDDDAHDSDGVVAHGYFESKIQVISNVVFIIASSIYVAMEVTVLPYYQFYKNVPYHVRESDDEVVWMQYYNETNAFPDYLQNATDDTALMEWYNNSFLDEGEELNEFVFQVPNAARKYENPEEELAAWVSQYMMLYFCAALGFLVTGILELYIARDFWSTILYGVMILAAMFGILSSLFVNKDPDVSMVFNAVSVHLFALEAISIVISRFRTLKRLEKETSQKVLGKDEEETHALETNELSSCLGLPIMAWLCLGDVSFLIGTSGDVVLSYFYVLEQDYLEHAIAAVVTATFWLLAGLFYLGVSSLIMHRTKQHFLKAGLNEKPTDVRAVQLIVLSLLVLAVVIVVLGIAFGLDTKDLESDFVEEEIFNITEASIDLSPDASKDISINSSQSLMGACNMTLSTFSESTMVLTLAVTSTITNIEVQYVANVLAKTYEAMIQNNLGDGHGGFCDPFCRKITQVSIVETVTENIFDSSEQQANICEKELKVTLSVGGTYWACEGVPFPGLFSEPTSDNQGYDSIGKMAEDTTCQVCIDDSNIDRLNGPTSLDLLEAMKPYVTVLGSVCDLLSAEFLDEG